MPSPRSQRSSLLRRLGDRVLETRGFEGLTALLTRSLPEALRVRSAHLLLFDRKLEAFEPLDVETQRGGPRPAAEAVAAPEARYLISEGQLVETHGRSGTGALVPLLSRTGLVGMLVLGERKGRRRVPYTPAEARQIGVVATRAALALENHIYERELIASERMAALGTMAGMLAHDFRGPMTVIRGYAETLLEPMPGGDVKSRAELIIQMVDRLERMTAETLDFARGGARLARRPVILPSALEELLAGIAQELPGLQVVSDFKVQETAAMIDVDKLRRAIGNLAANARDAMGGSGRIHVSAGLSGGFLLVTLRDEGPGVPEAVRDTLFEPFVTHGKKGGTGLGLAVARRFVEDHGGAIELLREGPGAAFRIKLPL